jgi:hypothetical protein
MKQSSIDWLEEQYYESEGKLTRHDFEQAKQMEKEQIKSAWYDGISGGQCGDSEQYYNETYDTNTTTTN